MEESPPCLSTDLALRDRSLSLGRHHTAAHRVEQGSLPLPPLRLQSAACVRYRAGIPASARSRDAAAIARARRGVDRALIDPSAPSRHRHRRLKASERPICLCLMTRRCRVSSISSSLWAAACVGASRLFRSRWWDAASHQSGHGVGADLVAAFCALQRPHGSVPGGCWSGKGGTRVCSFRSSINPAAAPHFRGSEGDRR